MNKAEVERIQKSIVRKCANCDAYHDGKSECRRHAPRPIVGLKLEHYFFVWPSTKAEDWCGEFTPRKR